jgi:sarcosine oxidase subunit delta
LSVFVSPSKAHSKATAMLVVACPNCGDRNASEFHFGGEYQPRPHSTEAEEWTNYLYMKDNRSDLQTEWWFHRAGCGLWFLVERNTLTNQIFKTNRWQASETEEADEL